MTALDLLILTLAAARLVRLVTTDTITAPLRELIWARLGGPDVSRVGYLITCNWCTAIYASSLLLAMYKIAHEFTIFFAAVLAVAFVSAQLANRVD